jgi:hypothetical protein
MGIRLSGQPVTRFSIVVLLFSVPLRLRGEERSAFGPEAFAQVFIAGIAEDRHQHCFLTFLLLRQIARYFRQPTTAAAAEMPTSNPALRESCRAMAYASSVAISRF